MQTPAEIISFGQFGLMIFMVYRMEKTSNSLSEKFDALSRTVDELSRTVGELSRTTIKKFW